MKRLYLIRHAKSSWKNGDLSDFERGLNRRGEKDLKTITSYISLKDIKVDLILSSSALRAQITADEIAKKIEYNSKIHYMKELYMVRPEKLMDIIKLQDEQHETIFMVGHNPELTEVANILLKDDFIKMPTLAILAIDLDIENWNDIKENSGKLDFYIYPKQFQYYMPKQIRAVLDS